MNGKANQSAKVNYNFKTLDEIGINQNMQLLLGNEKDFDLHQRIFNFYCILGLFISLIFSALTFCLGLPRVNAILMLAFAAVTLFCWYLSRVRRFFGVSTFLASFILIFLVTPCLWILNAGTNGGAQYFFIFWGILICSVYSDRRRYIWLMFLFVVISVLMYVEYAYPSFIMAYNSQADRYFDVYTSFILAMLSTTIIFIIYANNYQKEHKYVTEYTQYLEKIVITDGLTGLYNQTYLHSRLKEEIYKAERYQRSLSLIMIDIDYFKKLNDTYGHPAGNAALVQLANILRSSTRTSEIAGRYGGDEFLIVCPETNLEGAVSISKKLSLAVGSNRFGESGQIKMTISCGTATWNGETPDQFIEKTDQALYAAKRASHNQLEYRQSDSVSQ